MPKAGVLISRDMLWTTFCARHDMYAWCMGRSVMDEL